MTNAIEIRDLTVAYNEKPAVWDVDLDVPFGARMAIIGPNGAGKSTLLKASLELIPRVAGAVRIHGEPYAKNRNRVAYVPQRAAVDWDFPTDALDVVLMGTYGSLGWLKRPGRSERELAMTQLEEVGMADYAKRQISQLSGGQQQRVFLARALAQRAEVYVMDEPFAGVDATTELVIADLFRKLQGMQKTVVVVHHDLETVRDYFDHVALLNVRLKASGPIEGHFTQENLAATYGRRLEKVK